MVGGHVRHDADVAVIETETRSNNTAPRRFEYGDIDGRVFQHQLRRDGTGGIAADDLLVLDIRSVGRRKSERTSATFPNVGDQASRARFAVRACNGNYRDPRRRAAREEHIYNMLVDVSA